MIATSAIAPLLAPSTISPSASPKQTLQAWALSAKNMQAEQKTEEKIMAVKLRIT